MIGRCTLGRAPLFACLRSFVAGGSFCPGHRCAIPYIDDVNINLTGVAFTSGRIFTLSTFVAQYTREVISVSIGHSTLPSRPGHLPPAPRPGSRAAGSSPRRTGRIATAIHDCSLKVVVNSLTTEPGGRARSSTIVRKLRAPRRAYLRRASAPPFELQMPVLGFATLNSGYDTTASAPTTRAARPYSWRFSRTSRSG